MLAAASRCLNPACGVRGQQGSKVSERHRSVAYGRPEPCAGPPPIIPDAVMQRGATDRPAPARWSRCHYSPRRAQRWKQAQHAPSGRPPRSRSATRDVARDWPGPKPTAFQASAYCQGEAAPPMPDNGMAFMRHGRRLSAGQTVGQVVVGWDHRHVVRPDELPCFRDGPDVLGCSVGPTAAFGRLFRIAISSSWLSGRTAVRWTACRKPVSASTRSAAARPRGRWSMPIGRASCPGRDGIGLCQMGYSLGKSPPSAG